MKSPEFVDDVFALCTEQAIRCAKAQIEAGADIIGIGDAAASSPQPGAVSREGAPL